MIHKWVRKRSRGIIIMLVEYGFHTCSLARFHVASLVRPGQFAHPLYFSSIEEVYNLVSAHPGTQSRG